MSQRLGVEDPEQWLEEVPERVYKNWVAHYRCEPFGGERELLAKVVALLYTIAMQHTEFDAVQKMVDAIVPGLMPSDWIGQPVQKDESKSMDEVERQMEARYG